MLILISICLYKPNYYFSLIILNMKKYERKRTIPVSAMILFGIALFWFEADA